MNTNQSINVGVKTQLAKLLATENITVQYNPSSNTAYFDVKERILNFPVWQNISEDLHDMLSIHETGHAIDTPPDGWESAMHDIAKKYYNDDAKKYLLAIKTYLNVIEDARIDKRQKRRYPGSRRNYINAYKELYERDFFGVNNVPIETLTFIDRINLYFKGGNIQFNIPFSPEEKRYLKRIENIETWDQVVELTDEIYGLAKSKLEEEQSISKNEDFKLSKTESSDDDSDLIEDDFDMDGDENDASTSNDGNISNDDVNENEYSDDRGGYDPDGIDPNEVIPEAKTDNIFEENKKQFVSSNNYTFNYFKIPHLNHNEIIHDYKKVLNDYRYAVATNQFFIADDLREDFAKFRANENATISYMVKEFETRKAADIYSRVGIAKTGVINTNKLHTYNHNDDIFRRITVVPNGKNHGFVMFVDWSGSMWGKLQFTIQQLLTLVFFCKRVQIPFEVYLFRDAKNDPYKNTLPNDKDLAFNSFVLRNFLSSRMNVSELNEACVYLWKMRYIGGSIIDPLTGTPLNGTICAASKIVNEFKSRNKLQVVNTVFLTDGDSDTPVNFNLYGNYHYNNKQVNIIQDNITKKEYRFTSGRNVTAALLNSLKERTGSNVLGFFIPETKNIKRLLERFNINFYSEYGEKIKKCWTNEKFFPINSEGYDEYYVIKSPDNNNNETPLIIDSKMTVTKIAREFKKFSQKKAVNRILLNKFIRRVTNTI